jgi:anti-sigma factor RsiW
MTQSGLGRPQTAPPSGCDEWGHAVTLHVDGELGEVERAAFESHLESCERCREADRFEQSFREALQSKVPVATASANLRARLRLAIDEEAAQSRSALDLIRRLWSPYPLAAAGATALGLTAWIWAGGPTDDIVRELVSRHSREWPLDVTSSDPQTLEDWLSKRVDFHVKVPRPVSGMPLNLQGARLSNMHEHAAVYLVYSTAQSPSRRVSMLVYDDPSNRIPSPGNLKKIDDTDVYMANRAGYNVAMWKKNEVTYSLVSDREDDVENLVRASYQQ